MFEARFQTFDDACDRDASAARVAALRAELARRDLDRTDRAARRPASERICAGLRRAARLADRLHRLGRRSRSCLTTAPCCSSTAATPCRRANRSISRSSPLRIWSSCRQAAGSSRTSQRRAHRLRSVAAHRRSRREARQGLRKGRRHAGSGRRQSDRCDLDRPAAAAARPGRAARPAPSPAKTPPTSCARSQRELAKLRADALVVSDPHDCRLGCSTSAAPTSRIRRCRWRSRSCRATARPALYVDGRKLINDVRDRLEELADVRAPATSPRDLDALGRAQAHGAARPGDRRRCAGTADRRQAGGKVVRGADPIALMKAVKNAAEIAGARAAHRATASRWRASSPGSTARRRRASSTEIDAVEALETLPPRHRPAARTCRSRPSPAPGPNGAIVHYRVTNASNRDDRTGRTVPDRFRRAVRGRHHRHHPHRCGRHAERRDARPLHPRAQGPHRHRARGLSATAPPAPSSIRWRAVPVAGRARLRSRHRPRRRQLSVGA